MDQQLLVTRKEKVEVMGRAHAMMAESLERKQKLLVIPTIIMSTIVGAATIAALGDFGKAKFWLDLTVCVFSVLVAISTALQQYLDFAAGSQKHAGAAAAFFALGRRLDVSMRRAVTPEEINELDDELSAIIERVPRVSIEIQQKAFSDIRQERKISPGFVAESRT